MKKMKRKWLQIRTSIIFIFLVFVAIGIGTILWSEDVLWYYPEKLIRTEYSLRLARISISEFKRITTRNPHSLCEINQYAQKHPDSDLQERAFGEYLTDTNGNREEYQILNGQGGFFYNEETGEVKVNLTKPVKSYLHFYLGAKRNEIPADW